ncbi:MAG: transglycosylase SLT domain-containing protein, partial [Methyloglobulus sp.]
MRLLQITLIVLIGFTISFNYHDSVAASKASKSSSHQGHKSHGRSKGKKSVSKKGSGDVWERIRLGLRIPRPSPASPLFEQIASAKHLNMSATPESIKPTGVMGGADSQSTRLTTVITPSKLFKGESQLPEKFRTRHILIPQSGSQSKTGIIPRDKYTPLGRLKLGAKESSTLFKGRLANKVDATSNEKSGSVKSDNLFKSPSVQRIRTRLGLHPELFKQEDVAGNPLAENKTASNDKVKVQKQTAIQNCSDLNKQEIVNLAHQGLLPESYSELAKQCLIRQNANYGRVSQHIAGYSQRKGALYQASERARPYIYHIVDSLGKHNLPLDLALLPIVESAFQATALSNKEAAGIWQFIPSTGREYGLQQNASYDGRFDITASTHAAIRFLSGLNAHYKGDWLLALAAYNSGQGTVDAAISRNQAEGLDTDFWSLDLPAETQDYVPRLLALSAIFENPANYDLKLRPVKNEPYFIKVNIDRETDINQLVQKDLTTIAKLADFDPGAFGLLNSAYLKSTITERKPFTLLMPISNANLLHQSLAFMAQSYKDESKEAL